MFATIVFSCLLLNVASTMGQTSESTECMPKAPHEMSEVADCCDYPSTNWLGSDIHEIMHSCHEASGMTKPPHFNPSQPPSPPDHSVIECMEECLLNKLGLIGSDGALKGEDIKIKAVSNLTGEWKTVVSNAIDKCLTSAAQSKSTSTTCTSGAAHLSKCFARECFFNCPSGSWTDSDVCKEGKTLLLKCPNLPSPIKHPHKHHHHHQ